MKKLNQKEVLYQDIRSVFKTKFFQTIILKEEEA